MKRWMIAALVPALALAAMSCNKTGSSEGKSEGKALKTAAANVPNPAMSAPDQVGWELFLAAAAPTQGGGTTFEGWASDAQTFSLNPVWPSERLAIQPRRARPTQLLGRGPAHALAAAVPAGGGTAAAGTPKGAAPEPGLQPNTLHDVALEEVRRNRPAFDYIVQNGLNKRSGLKAAFGKTIDFPAEAVEVKTNWLTVEQVKQYYPARVTGDIGANFFVVQNKEGVAYALVAMHVISKQVPNWTWATFEHNANPGRCDIIGCYDSFGAQQAQVPPAATPEGDYGPCPKTAALQNMWGDTPAALANYCLKGSQTDFIDPTGLAVRLGNSVTEGGFVESSSCMTCHATAGWNKDGIGTFSGAPIGPVPWQTFWTTANPPPVQNGPNSRIFTQADFVWAIPFCAYDDLTGKGAVCSGP
jgi:hypothetical protein